MAELKTKETGSSVQEFIDTVQDEQKRKDSYVLLEMMEKATGDKAKMWGANIVGCGYQKLKYDSGRELDWFPVGFSPRKAAISVYGIGEETKSGDAMARLGKVTMGKGCVYIKKLSDVNMDVLQELIDKSCQNKD